MRNYDKLVREIKEQNFKWKNSYLNKFMPSNYKQISQVCRIILGNLIDKRTYNPSTICFIYCFTNRDPQNSPIGPTKFVLRDGTIIDMEGKEGVFNQIRS